MNLQDQVTSLELSKHLKELGVKQESLFYWYKTHYPNVRESMYVDNDDYLEEGAYQLYNNVFSKQPIPVVYDYDENPVEYQCSAYTVAELGEMLPSLYGTWRTLHGKRQEKYCCFDDQKMHTTFLANTEANARAKMLIYLLENKLINI